MIFQIGKFLVVGGVGFVADLFFFISLSQFINIHISKILAFILAVQITYLLNKYWTFKECSALYYKYLVGQLGGFFINLSLFEWIIYLVPNTRINLILAAATSSVFVAIFNFLCSKFIAFKE